MKINNLDQIQILSLKEQSKIRGSEKKDSVQTCLNHWVKVGLKNNKNNEWITEKTAKCIDKLDL